MSEIANRRAAPIVVWQVALGLAFLLAWEWGVASKLLDKFFFSRPVDILARVGQWIWTGSIWSHLVVTLEEAFLSLTGSSIRDESANVSADQMRQVARMWNRR